jgi:hypothetical protein
MATQIHKVFIQIDNEKIELVGVDADNFEADREAVRIAKETEDLTRMVAKNNLLERLGITEDEAKLLLG